MGLIRNQVSQPHPSPPPSKGWETLVGSYDFPLLWRPPVRRAYASEGRGLRGRGKRKFLYDSISNFLIIIFLFASGCCSINYSQRGIKEEAAIDYSVLGAEVLEKADQLCTEFERNTEVLPTGHPLVVAAREAMESILQNNEPNSAKIGGEFFDRHPAFEYFSESKVLIVVLPRDAPLALVYPNGRLYVTTGLIDPTLPYATKNEAQLVGVLAHEFIHLRDGHVIKQWAAIESRRREVFKKAISDLTKALPILEFEYEPGATYAQAKYFNQLIEYNADRRALGIMEELGHDPKQYLAFLEDLQAYRDKHKNEAREPYGWIDGRVACMKQLFSPTEAKFLRFQSGCQ